MAALPHDNPLHEGWRADQVVVDASGTVRVRTTWSAACFSTCLRKARSLSATIETARPSAPAAAKGRDACALIGRGRASAFWRSGDRLTYQVR